MPYNKVSPLRHKSAVASLMKEADLASISHLLILLKSVHFAFKKTPRVPLGICSIVHSVPNVMLDQ